MSRIPQPGRAQAGRRAPFWDVKLRWRTRVSGPHLLLSCALQYAVTTVLQRTIAHDHAHAHALAHAALVRPYSSIADEVAKGPKPTNNYAVELRALRQPCHCPTRNLPGQTDAKRAVWF